VRGHSVSTYGDPFDLMCSVCAFMVYGPHDVDIDDELIAKATHGYHLETDEEAVDLTPNRLVGLRLSINIMESQPGIVSGSGPASVSGCSGGRGCCPGCTR